MRKLKLQVHISLDGFIAGPNGESEWVHTGSGQQPVIDLADTCDTILMGRKMARDFIDHWENVVAGDPEQPLAGRMVRMRKIVFSRTQTAIPGRNVEVAGGDLATTVRALKAETGKDLLVYGGAGFVSNLIELDLVDEYHLFVIPVALGEGMRIFKTRKKLKLIRSVAVGHLETISTYVPA
ncbi:MAG TPA: dihydrofolate reductase family protein [Dinghuibacter sp.]|jgi:dihydrofolate reductase|uniref:dihydrofolate reductase family protein n=1 Tax=Dinghuibacter sp. TaxID=2024697 RepID=UPI002BC3AD11|nr:dihydrofolate reductase family protein [Dinghuibacter sp.]HTJ12029.1 dihydrofolate reductase family protein [Dinghuibacter sp.]